MRIEHDPDSGCFGCPFFAVAAEVDDGGYADGWALECSVLDEGLAQPIDDSLASAPCHIRAPAACPLRSDGVTVARAFVTINFRAPDISNLGERVLLGARRIAEHDVQRILRIPEDARTDADLARLADARRIIAEHPAPVLEVGNERRGPDHG